MKIAERLECEIVPEGLSVTRTFYSDVWRLRVGRFMARIRVPKHQEPHATPSVYLGRIS
jgi:hypothetical protein